MPAESQAFLFNQIGLEAGFDGSARCWNGLDLH